MSEPTTPAPAPKIRQLFISAIFGLFLSLVATVVMLQVYVVPLLANHESRIAALEGQVAELEAAFDETIAEDAELPEEEEAAAEATDAGAPAAPAAPAAATDAGTP